MLQYAQNNKFAYSDFFPKSRNEGIFLAVSIFNEGFLAILNMISKMDIVLDRQAKIFIDNELSDREWKSDNRCFTKQHNMNFFLKKEDPRYFPSRNR